MMSKRDKKIGAEFKNGSNIKIVNSQFHGLDKSMTFKNVQDVVIEDAKFNADLAIPTTDVARIDLPDRNEWHDTWWGKIVIGVAILILGSILLTALL